MYGSQPKRLINKIQNLLKVLKVIVDNVTHST